MTVRCSRCAGRGEVIACESMSIWDGACDESPCSACGGAGRVDEPAWQSQVPPPSSWPLVPILDVTQEAPTWRRGEPLVLHLACGHETRRDGPPPRFGARCWQCARLR